MSNYRNPPRSVERKAGEEVRMLYLFDMDGTLIESFMDRPDRDYHTWQPLPGRGRKIAELRDAGHVVGIVTNQAGVALGFIKGSDFELKLADVHWRLRLGDCPIYVCFAHEKASDPRYRTPEQLARRKPSGAMLREAIAEYPHQAADGVLFVGDRPEDEAAARDAGVAFMWAQEFF